MGGPAKDLASDQAKDVHTVPAHEEKKPDAGGGGHEKPNPALTNLALVPAHTPGGEGTEAGHGGEHHVNIETLSEEQLRDLVLLRTPGMGEGMERYDRNVKPPKPTKPRRPDPKHPTKDVEYDYDTWHEALERLERLDVEQGSQEKPEFKNEVKPSLGHERYLGGVSSTLESRTERRAADTMAGDAAANFDRIEHTKGHHGRSAAKKLAERTEDERQRVHDETKDPIGEKEEKRKKEEDAKVDHTAEERKEAVTRVNEARAALEEATRKVDATKGTAEAKAEAERAKAELAAALDHAKVVGAPVTALARAYDALKSHTEVEIKGDIATKSWSTGEKEIMGERHDGVPGMLGSVTEGETHVGMVSADAKAHVGLTNDGLQAELAVGAKAVAFEVKEQWKWEHGMIWMGENVNVRLYLEVAGMLGVEAHAQLKANVGKVNPKEGKIDMNQVSAGVDGFAGLKVSVAIGSQLEWQKKGAEHYKGKLANAGKVLIDIITLANPPLGYLLRHTGGDAGAAKLLEHLMEWGQTGTVPLLGIEAKLEGSIGAGFTAQAGIGLRGGHFDFWANANATWGVGLGGKVKVSLDLVEGPKFALIELGELRPIAIQFAEEKVAQIKSGIQAGYESSVHFVAGLMESIADWWHSKDKAHALVDNKVTSWMTPAQNKALIESLFGWYCKEDDQAAIVQVLIQMKKNNQIGALGNDLCQRMMSKTDGNYHRMVASIIGWTAWK